MAQKAKASTQEHLDIEDVIDDFVVYKTGWVGLVLTTTAVNFDLLSEAEQDATIYAYGAFLNSLTFPVQIMIRSKKADITAYFSHLAEAEAGQTNPDIKKQIVKYRDFLQSIIQQKTVLDKSFYLIINFNPMEKGVKGIGLTPQKTKNKMQIVADAKNSLYPKRDHVMKQMSRLGLTVKQLTTKDLIELFYDIYNPAPTGTQRVILDSASYTVPIVEPAVEIPTSAPPQKPPTFDFTQTQAQASPTQTEPEGLRPVPPINTPVNPSPQIIESPNPLPPFPQQPAVKTPDVNPFPQAVLPKTDPPLQSAQVPPQIPTPISEGSVDNNQLEALRNLQEATAKAAQLINQSTTAAGPPLPGGIQK